ncbi:MAG: Rrf2 family transcriptional regulator, partial [Bacteriovoracaceae bacterium]
EVSDKFNTPFDTTAKVMQLMNNSNILISVKGVKGGYYLNQDLSTLSYMALAELIEGKTISIDCEDIKCSLLGSCNITGPIKKLNQYLNAFFRDLSVEQLLNEEMPIDLNALAKRRDHAHEL